MTRSALIVARSVVNSSVIPSAKYSWLESPEKLSRGSTAMERIGCAVAERAPLSLEGGESRRYQYARTSDAIAAVTMAATWRILRLRRCGYIAAVEPVVSRT